MNNDGHMNIFKRLFSLENQENYKIFNFLFFRLKLKKTISKCEFDKRINSLSNVITNEILNVQNKLLNKIESPKAKPVLPFLSIHMVNKCNNNCEACSHFCTLADDFVLNISDYEKDLAILAQKFHINEIDLMGGEPLLHPQISEIFDVTRKILQHTFICLHTNALLLKNMKEDFWESCRRNRICFKITKYPSLENFNEVVDLCLSNDIHVCSLINGNEFLHWMDKSGNGNVEDNFHACKTKFGCCYILKDSKLYTCPTACYMYLYNMHFDKNLPVEKGIDIIYSSPEDILKYLNTPIENCKYCHNVQKLKRKPWKRTSKNIDEWEDCKFEHEK